MTRKMSEKDRNTNNADNGNKSNTRKISDARYRANRKWDTSQYQPRIFVNKNYRADIEAYYKKLGCNTFNQWVQMLIKDLVYNGKLPSDDE